MLAWLVIIIVPAAFFLFGWRDVDVQCHRPAAERAPDCHVSETFAMGIYTRQSDALGVTGIGYENLLTRSSGSSFQTLTTSTVVLNSGSGDVPISRVSSNADVEASRELILDVRSYLESGTETEFHYHVEMHSLFGYLGLAGIVGLVLMAIAFVWRRINAGAGEEQAG